MAPPRIFLALLLALAVGTTHRASSIRYTWSVRVEGGAAASAEGRGSAREGGLLPSAAAGDFEVVASAGKVRQNFLADFASFQKGDYLLADTRTKTAAVVMPGRRQYAQMDLRELQAAMLAETGLGLGTASDAKIDVQELPPRTVGDYACSGKRIALLYTLTPSSGDPAGSVRTEEVTEYWSTADLSPFAYFGNVAWHRQGMTTGDEQFDALVAARVGALGFPVEIRTRKTVDGRDEGTTVFSLEEVHLDPVVAPGTFTVPSGFARVSFGAPGLQPGGDRGAAPEGRPRGEEAAEKPEAPRGGH